MDVLFFLLDVFSLGVLVQHGPIVVFSIPTPVFLLFVKLVSALGFFLDSEL